MTDSILSSTTLDGALTTDVVVQAVAMSHLGVWHRDLDSDHVRCNDHMFRLLGLAPSPGGLSAARVVAMQHPDDRAHAQALNRAVLAGTGPLEIQLRYLLADGRVLHLLSRRSLVRDADGRPKGLLGVTLDMSERHAQEQQGRQALRELTHARERIALAAEGAGIGTWEWFAGDSRSLWDDNMFRLRGLVPRAQALTHTERMQLVYADDREMVQRVTERSMLERGPMAYEFRIVRPDGSIRWIASRSMRASDVDGEVRRIGVNWDITDRIAAETARRDAEVALRESQAKSRFMARMSHELRTPLNAVLGFTQLLLADAAPGADSNAGSDADAGANGSAGVDAARDNGSARAGAAARGMDATQRRQSLAHIERAGQHLLHLINDVLDLARVEGGEMTLQRAPVALAGLVQRTLPLLAPQAEAASVRLVTGALDHAVLGDETRLCQVLLNLVGNGIKYNHAGGEVHVDAVAAGALVHLRVRDNGRGIAAAKLGYLFQPFNRLGAESEAIEGTGIGLAIVKSLVEHMGGHVQVSSRSGEGSLFEVVLPRAAADDPAAPAPAPSSPAGAGAAQGTSRGTKAAVPAGGAPGQARAAPAPGATPGQRDRHVLYIEDNAVNALIVREVLATMPGYRITVAPDGTSGLEAALREQPDLVLLDMHLPDMDGFAVLRKLREQPQTAHLTVVALSANVMPDQISRAMAAGLTDYWTKPLDMALFIMRMKQLLPPHTA